MIKPSRVEKKKTIRYAVTTIHCNLSMKIKKKVLNMLDHNYLFELIQNNNESFS